MNENHTYVLGLNCGHDGSVALIKDRKLVAFIATERLSRFKKDRGVTKKAIKYVLDKEGIKLKDVAFCGIVNWFWDRDGEGNELWDKSEEGFSIITNNGIEYSLEDHQTFYQNPGMAAQGFYTLNIGDQVLPCMLVDHHFAHCAASYFLSPYEDAVCLSVDFADNMGTSHSVYYFNDKHKSYRPLRRGGDFNIGGFYGSICDFLGFYPSLTDAGKVMALAAYGKDSVEIEDIVWPNNMQMGDLFHGDQYQHLLYRHGINRIPERQVYFPQLKDEGGIVDEAWQNKEDWDFDLTKNIARDAQSILEKSIENMVSKIAKEMGNFTKNICFSGGTMLNCVSNGKLYKKLSTYHGYNLFIPPAVGDDGLAIGAALFLSNNLTINRKKEIKIAKVKKPKAEHSLNDIIEGGKSYSDVEIMNALSNDKIEYTKLSTTPLIDSVASDIKDDKIVAFFRGGSEVGPRALGHRSILANAINPDMKDILNKRVKHRESFRPFAPMVLKEKVEDWFEIKESEFMLFSVDCIHSKIIPSATHIDGTARVQTISEENGIIHDIIKKFDELTKVPVIINTSFNVMGEPIVESPDDAIRCFLGTDIDVLYIENFKVTKK